MVTDNGFAFNSTSHKDEFYQLFFSNYLLNDACNDCLLRSTLHYTDIRLGDFWGRCYDKNIQGVSAVTLVTEKGKSAFENIVSLLHIKRHDFEDFLPFQSWGKKYKLDKQIRVKMFDLLENDQLSLNTLQAYYYSKQNFRQKVKRGIKNLLAFCPVSWMKTIKFIYHSIS